MPDANDIALLREYADFNSESAFSEIVHRRINLVYSVALRLTGNGQDAQDVTQAVFVILAKKAADISPKTVLTGWLYETTRFTAMNFLTCKTRRHAREQEAYMQSILDSNTESIWRQLAPMLEEAMARLSEKERTLVALRFFENRSVAETAAALGIQEWAVRKRLERALGKLQQFFAKRGVSSTAATIAGAISSNSVQTAPIGLTKTISAVAIAKGATASASTLTLITGALKIMAWTKVKTAVVAGVVVLLVVGTATVSFKKMAHPVSAPGKGQSDANAFQGTWSGQEAGGPPGSSLTVQGSNLEFHGANPKEWYKATFTFREDTVPKQLIAVITDCVAPQYVGKTSCAIYQIQGGTFTMVGNEPGNPKVPSSFDAPDGRKFVFTKK
jgi:RNA polymerase sigma factor (sigma-70 family)